jgi:hypothetical protein
MITINITSIPGGIALDQGNGNVTSAKNGKVQWNPGSGIESIAIVVTKREGDIDIWSSLPAPLGKSKNWQGTVGGTAGQEYYSVDWVKTDGTSGNHDPVITVSGGNQ